MELSMNLEPRPSLPSEVVSHDLEPFMAYLTPPDACLAVIGQPFTL